MNCLFPPTYLVSSLFWLCEFFCLFWLLMSYHQLSFTVLEDKDSGYAILLPCKIFQWTSMWSFTLTIWANNFDVNTNFSVYIQIVHQHFL